jgi:hypothetical protein
MLKPNIRGISKKALRFTIRGWRDTNNGSLIKHRFPWRRSWTELLAIDSKLRPTISRAGQVYLISNEPIKDVVASQTRIRKPILILVILVAVIVFGILGTDLISGTGFQKSATQPETSLQRSTERSCSQIFENPTVTLEQLLGGQESRVVMTEISRDLIGGVQSRVVNLSCEGTTSLFQLQLTKNKGLWSLNKLARLNK